MPGLAVDHQGARIGQGGGFYDTAFGAETDSGTPSGAESVSGAAADHETSARVESRAEHPGTRGALRFIAVVHASEVLSPGDFPVESHDLRVHVIVTERGAITLRPL